MPKVCCKCNRRGQCRNCICRKNGQSCVNFLPHRLNKCKNSCSSSISPSSDPLPNHLVHQSTNALDPSNGLDKSTDMLASPTVSSRSPVTSVLSSSPVSVQSASISVLPTSAPAQLDIVPSSSSPVSVQSASISVLPTSAPAQSDIVPSSSSQSIPIQSTNVFSQPGDMPILSSLSVSEFDQLANIPVLPTSAPAQSNIVPELLFSQSLPVKSTSVSVLSSPNHQIVPSSSSSHPKSISSSCVASASLTPPLHDCQPTATAASLPDFRKCHLPSFKWGHHEGSDFCRIIDATYKEVIHWKRNLFKVPSGKNGNDFVRELARLISAYQQDNPLECIAMKAIMILPILLLQKPSAKSKCKDHSKFLGERLIKWKAGAFDELLIEGRTIQGRLINHQNGKRSNGNIAKAFDRLVSLGNIKAAIRLITEDGNGAPLQLSQQQPDGRTTKDHLLDKHPEPQPLRPEALYDGPVKSPMNHPVAFSAISAEVVRQTIQRMSGSAGPSGLDINAWKRLCFSFHGASNELCEAIALLCKRLCTEYVDPVGLEALVASRLIALDKNPGIRPIGIGECLRRLVGKVVVQSIKMDILRVVGKQQLCVSHVAGCEAAIHTLTNIFERDDCEAILFVDASNAFNSINRQVALHNVQKIFPLLAPMIINTYRIPSSLFIDGDFIMSKEGVTQGDPMAMAFYAIATIPLIEKLKEDMLQVWYADDAAGTGKLSPLRTWWDNINSIGPAFGYYPNASKSHILVKEHLKQEAHDIFKGTNLQIITDGKEYLGGSIGTHQFANEFISSRVRDWITNIDTLSEIAQCHPQAALTVMTHGFMSKWTYLMRVSSTSDDQWKPLEAALREKFLPALSGRQVFSDTERNLLSLPAKLGGIGVTNPTQSSGHQYKASQKISAPLMKCMQKGVDEDVQEVHLLQKKLKTDVHHTNHQEIRSRAKEIQSNLPRNCRTAIEQSCEDGASSWLTAIPITDYGFKLHKQAFRDALCLRYGWPLRRPPSHCACGTPFNINHAFSCPKGAFPIIRHNKIRDLLAELLTEVCPCVAVEPVLQPLSGEHFQLRSTTVEDNARLDVCARDFWDKSRTTAFFDVKIFNAHAPSNCSTSISSCYRKHEMDKRRKYEQRIIDVEHGTFTPFVMSSSGGMGPSATITIKRLASLLAEKTQIPYPVMINTIRCRLSFSLIESAVMCIRGARSSINRPAKADHECPALIAQAIE